MHPYATEPTKDRLDRVLAMPDASLFAVKRDYINGDHWRGGQGYIGPVTTDTDPEAMRIMARIQRLFASKNLSAEIVRRQADTAFTRAPEVAFQLRERPPRVPDPNFQPVASAPNLKAPLVLPPPTEQQQRLIDEATNAVSTWLKESDALERLREAFENRLWASRGCVRLFIPQSKDRNYPTLEDALGALVVEAPSPEHAHVDRDPLTGDDLAVIKFLADREREVFAYEISYVDANERTFVGVMGEDSSTPSLSRPINMGGRLTSYEIAGNPMVTPQILQINTAINLALTMANHVMVEAGFSEMAVTNVALPTKEVPDPNRPGQTMRVPVPLRRGSGVLNNLVGITTHDAEGSEELARPDVHWKSPTPVDTHQTGKEMFYRIGLEEARQTHALIAGDATPSGEARRQALTDFLAATWRYKTEIDKALRWLCETALYLAANLSGKADQMLTLRAVADSRIYVGDLSVEDQQALLAQVEKKLRSRRNARLVLGIDPDAEEAQVFLESASAGPNADPNADPNVDPNPDPNAN